MDTILKIQCLDIRMKVAANGANIFVLPARIAHVTAIVKRRKNLTIMINRYKLCIMRNNRTTTASKLEDKMELILRIIGEPYEREKAGVHPTRKWRLDFYYEQYKLAIEVQGGQWLGAKTGYRHIGRHNRPLGMQKDYEKHNAFLQMGIKILYYTTDDVNKNQLTIKKEIETMIERIKSGELDTRQQLLIGAI